METVSLQDGTTFGSSAGDIFLAPGLFAILGLSLAAVYCMLALYQVTRAWEPQMGQRAHRPRGLSATTLRWVRYGRFDSASLTAAVLALASKGAVEVAVETKHVRLYKAAQAKHALTRCESVFATGFLRLYSSILLNQHADAALRRGAAALQDGIDSEWRSYQSARLHGLFRPAFYIAACALILAALFSGEFFTFLLRALPAAGAFGIAIFCTGKARDALGRVWWETLWQTGRFGFYSVATLAAAGVGWMLLGYNRETIDLAALAVALAFAAPMLAYHEAVRSRWTAGPLRGQINAIRGHLHRKASGVDVVVFDHDFTPPAANTNIASAPRTLDLDGEQLYSWLPDAVALETMPSKGTTPVAPLELAFERPDRLASVLRAAAAAQQRNLLEAKSGPRAITAQS